MPELPEVETVRLQLLHKVVNKTIKTVSVFNKKSAGSNPRFEKILSGQTIHHIDRVGKLLIFSFANKPDLFILTHLKMTGQFFFVDNKSVIGGGHSQTPADTKELPNKHTRIAFQFTDGTNLYFNDMRMFGYMKIASKEEMLAARATYGQEPIIDHFDFAAFTEKIRRRTVTVKAALLDQKLIAGLGNIYVDETLFATNIRPTRRANRLTKKEAAALAETGGAIMKRAIEVGGTTFQHFVDTGGQTGNYTDYLKVFGKQGTECPKCKTPIKKIRVAGRGTHFCPKCQK